MFATKNDQGIASWRREAPQWNSPDREVGVSHPQQTKKGPKGRHKLMSVLRTSQSFPTSSPRADGRGYYMSALRAFTSVTHFIATVESAERSGGRLRGLLATHLILKFHKLTADCCITDVLGPVCYRITIDNVAGLEVCLSDSTVSAVGADLSTRDDIDDIGGMRVHLFLNAWSKSRLENTYARVFEFQGDAL